MKVIERSGSCLCGSVKFTVKNLAENVEACHCGMCRKWGGGPLMAVNCGQNISFDGKENIAVYDSSQWAERGFCKNCGSHLFYRLKENSEHQIPVGLFENQEGFKLNLQVYIDKKPSFYCFKNETDEMTEQEVIEKFAP